jgi:Domain of unknown function (DUF7014)/AbiJ N-terminal domain 4
MAIFDLYSRRKREQQNSGKADVYRYDEIPLPLRRQIIDIWKWATGPVSSEGSYSYTFRNDWSWNFWVAIADDLRHEKGFQTLAQGNDPFAQCTAYFLSLTEIDDLLDVLELTFRYISSLGSLNDWQRSERQISMPAAEAIDEVNFRLQEAGVGCQFENGEIIEVNSKYIHAEAVKPALALLSDPRFDGPHQEFLYAHERYRTARDSDTKGLEDAIATALKAYESTLKVICDLRRWERSSNATAAPLIQLIIDKGLVPPYLKSTLESLATLSNRTSQHGQGGQVRKTPKYFAAYALHQVAANIVMLVEVFQASETP